MITASATYVDGVPHAPPDPGFEALARGTAVPGGLVWVDLADPSQAELDEVAEAFGLHPLAAEDALHAHQRSKLDRYGDRVFVVLRPALYSVEDETVSFGELHVFTGPGFIITVRHGSHPDLAGIRHDLEARPDLLQIGPGVVLHAILDLVVDDYLPVAAGIEDDIDEIEDALFADGGDTLRRTYELVREVIGFQRALKPLLPITTTLMDAHAANDDEQRYLRDVQDHVIRLLEQADGFRQLLEHILHVNLALETKAMSERSHQQDGEIKRISAWAAIIFAPTVVGTVYGMNFRHMPELQWEYGYLWALGLMVAIALALYGIFRRRDWL